MPLSIPFLLNLLLAILGTALLVHAANRALHWFIDRAPTEPPSLELLRHLREGVEDARNGRTTSLAPTELDIPVDVDPLSPEPFVDAHETLLPLEDSEHIRCALCGEPLSSLTQEHCWVCESPNDRSAA